LAGNRVDLGAVNNLNQYSSNQYDVNGALTQDGRFVYTYDDADRLISVKSGSTVIASYEYDAMGRKVKKVANGQETNYTRFGRQMLSEEKG
jgi:YD repeat-containing protein